MRVRTLATISIGLLSAACQAPYSQNSATAPAYGSASQSSSAACADYGFRPGTTNFNQCVANEQRARANGRVNRDYTPTQLTVDARNACNSYGLAPGTATWDRCVSREVDARTYRSDAAAPVATYYTDQNGYRVDGQGYRVDANGYRIAGQTGPSYQTAPSYQPAAQAYAGQSIPPYRVDQYNNQVDADGYRVDSNGYRLPAQGQPMTTYSTPTYYTPTTQAFSTQPVSRDEFGNRYDAQGDRVDANGRVLAMPVSR